MKIFCPECDFTLEILDVTVAAGVPKARCVRCSSKFTVLSSGVTMLLDQQTSGSGTTVGQGGPTVVPNRINSAGASGAVGSGGGSGAGGQSGSSVVPSGVMEAEADWRWAEPGCDTKVPELGMSLVWIEPGSFMMGDDTDGPRHRVTLSRGYWLGRYAVTQGEYEAVTGNNPSLFRGSKRLPVEDVSWNEAMSYCEALNRRYGSSLPSGYRFTLPTEAQWEYACLAGSTGKYCYGDGEDQLGSYAWYDDNSGDKPHAVGEKRSNRWGLHDMHGNMWEWCSDWSGSYPSESVTDPTGPGTGSDRVRRGGSWWNDAAYCRSAGRNGIDPSFRYFLLGFRVAISSRP